MGRATISGEPLTDPRQSVMLSQNSRRRSLERRLSPRRMMLNERALHEAAQDIFTSLGPLNDLGPELSNTVANVYYRFHVMRQNMTNPGDALGVKPGKDMRSNFLNVTGAVNKTY